MLRTLACALLAASTLCGPSLAAPPPEQSRTYGLTLILKHDPQERLTLRELNNRGEIVGVRDRYPDPTQTAFVWSAGKVRELNSLLAADVADANSINDRSEILVRYFDDRLQQWRAAIIRGTRVTHIEPQSDEAIIGAVALNDRRQAVVSTLFGENFHSRLFVWDRGQRTVLEEPAGTDLAYATDINDRGIVSGATFKMEDHSTVPLIWRAGAATIIQPPAGSLGVNADGINNRGVTLLNVFFGSGQPIVGTPYLWVGAPSAGGERLIELPPLSGHDSAQGNDLNDFGVVVGSSFDSDPEAEPAAPVVWRRNRGTDLNTLISAQDPLQPFVGLSAAWLINARGQIVATGRDVRDDRSMIGYYLLTPR